MVALSSDKILMWVDKEKKMTVDDSAIVVKSHSSNKRQIY